MLWVVTVAWLYIKPFRNVSSKEPTSDPVDSDPEVLAAKSRSFWTDGLIPVGLCYPSETLTVFTRLACSQKIYFLNQLLEKMLNRKRNGKFTCFTLKNNLNRKGSKRSGSQLKRCSNIFFTRCGLSSTYHLVPLTLLQYDTKPTR
jgi:hypothetical protein